MFFWQLVCLSSTILYVFFFIQNTLYNRLIQFRNGIAHELNIAPFMVATNTLLGELAKAR